MGNVVVTQPDTLGGGSGSGAHALVGMTLGAYRIERLLGAGAMGEVFLATHVALGRPVALKMLKPAVAADRTLTERFFAEARAVNIIRHENIVECTDLVNDPDGRSYIVMELLEGTTLGAAIVQAGRIPPRRAAHIVAQIADAIAAAHDKGIVHRDLKPENVYLIRRAGSSDYVKVLDFGIARLRPELGGMSATQTGELLGTPAYMSPEQVRGDKAGPASDIYAVGVILFYMLAGRLPFETPVMSMMLVAQLDEPPPRLETFVPDAPKPLADLVARALAKEAAERPADMATFRREVLQAVGLPSDSHVSLDAPPAAPRSRSVRWPWIAAGGAVIVAAVIAAAVVAGSGGSPSPAATADAAPGVADLAKVELPKTGRPCDAETLSFAAQEVSAKNQWTEALSLYERAIACAPSDSLTVRAFMAACYAHDAAKAKRYYASIPPSRRTSLAASCLREGIQLEPDAP